MELKDSAFYFVRSNVSGEETFAQYDGETWWIIGSGSEYAHKDIEVICKIAGVLPQREIIYIRGGK